MRAVYWVWLLKEANATPIRASRPSIPRIRIRTTPRREAGDGRYRTNMGQSPCELGLAVVSELVGEVLADGQDPDALVPRVDDPDLDLDAPQRRRVRRRIRRVDRPG